MFFDLDTFWKRKGIGFAKVSPNHALQNVFKVPSILIKVHKFTRGKGKKNNFSPQQLKSQWELYEKKLVKVQVGNC